jgi:hypothetical protein
MDKRINDLKIDFTRVVDLKNENVKMFDTLDIKIKNLKSIHAEFIKNNKQQLFIFGLDSFHFQGKIIDIEYDDMKRLYYAITNRIYCEYFKLYKIVLDYIIENMIDDKKMLEMVKVDNNYPTYKDLEPFKHYDFEIIQSVHEAIIGLLIAMHNYLSHKEHDLKLHQEKNAIGLNIDNFIQTFYFNNLVLREKLALFTCYMEFFHKLHIKYFKRFTTKMQLFISQINNDIKFEDSAELNKTKRISMLEHFANDNVDKDILQDLKHSVAGDTPHSPSMQLFTQDSDIFQPIALNIPSPSPNITQTSERRVDVKSQSLNSVFLQIEEQIDGSINSDFFENKKEEKQEEKQEEKRESDDISLLTTESETQKSEAPMLSDEPKTKRKYKQRKKKGDPEV